MSSLGQHVRRGSPNRASGSGYQNCGHERPLDSRVRNDHPWLIRTGSQSGDTRRDTAEQRPRVLDRAWLAAVGPVVRRVLPEMGGVGLGCPKVDNVWDFRVAGDLEATSTCAPARELVAHGCA